MPPRRRSNSAAPSLTADELTALTAALDEGRRATVYLREAVPGLGLAAGVSARVVSVAGTTVTVRPRGVDDELPFEADELRMTKTAPPEPAPAPKAAPTPAAKPATRRPAKRGPQAVTITVHGTVDNEWSVAVTRGGTKPQRARRVTAEAVDAAVEALGDTAAGEAVTALLNAARDEAQRRVEELSRELEAAKAALAALDTE